MFGLDRHIINDENSRMSWNHKHYPFDAWNKEQDLNTQCKIQLIGTSNVLAIKYQRTILRLNSSN